MSMWMSIAAVAAVAFLSWNLYRRFGTDAIARFNDQRRATSRIVGRGEFVDGNRHLDVALAVSDSTLFYENSDMQASLDLRWVREVEYDSDFATGSAPANGKVLRLRSQSQTFEFVLANEDVARWHTALPARSENVVPR